MPIGWLIGLSVALLWGGWTLSSANKKKYIITDETTDQELAVALQCKRFFVIGITMMEIGSLTLTGILIELLVRR